MREKPSNPQFFFLECLILWLLLLLILTTDWTILSEYIEISKLTTEWLDTVSVHCNKLSHNFWHKTYCINDRKNRNCMPWCSGYQWRCGVVVITAAQLHSTKPELRFCTGSNPARGVSEIRNGEDCWQWSQLEIMLKAFRQSTIPQKQFIIIIIIIIMFQFNFK